MHTPRAVLSPLVDPYPPVDDDAWDARYPPALRPAAALHFAPVRVAELAADWLAAAARAVQRPVIDLGAGAGKFCLVAAERHRDVEWVGAELRPALLAEAERQRAAAGLDNLCLLTADITTLELAPYAGAFLFNPFYEQLDASATELGPGLLRGRAAYRAACAGLRQNLTHAPADFRLVAYYCHGPELPAGWRSGREACDGRLEEWIKP